MTQPPVQHLVAVWNPSYGSDVMESHIRLLRESAQRFRDGRADEEDVYVWWGKIRSAHRQTALKNLDDIIAVGANLIDDEGQATREIQLYLTDYRSLYVAHVSEITIDDQCEEDDVGHVPAIYRQKSTHCDCWFRLWDIRRLVSDDTLAVIDELKKLNNTAYHDMPVSLYGGMVDLPLIVTRPDGARYFEEDVRNQLIDGAYWVEFDSEHSGIGATERELRENHFGAELWARLDAGTRTFIATAEKLYRDQGNDASFDFSPVILSFAKAFEVQTNILLRSGLERARADERMANIGGRTRDVVTDGPWTLGELALIIGDNENVNSACRKQLASPGGAWFTVSLPPILKQLADVRNPAAHSGILDRDTVRRLRNQYLGVGCEGDLVKLAKVRRV